MATLRKLSESAYSNWYQFDENARLDEKNRAIDHKASARNNIRAAWDVIDDFNPIRVYSELLPESFASAKTNLQKVAVAAAAVTVFPVIAACALAWDIVVPSIDLVQAGLHRFHHAFARGERIEVE